MSETLYTQTRLERTVNGGRQEMVTWLPAKHAVKGKVLALKDADTEQWEDGWKVLDDPGEPYMPEHVLIKQSRDYRRTREASDI